MPGPIVLRTSCGGFRLAPNGTVTRVPRSWFDARSGGTGRRYGANLRIERTRPGRIVLLRQGRVVWRSHSLFRNDGGSMALGPGAFAFAAHRHGIFVTDLRSPERLIARGVGLYPLAFLRDGTLLVVRGGWGASVVRLTQEGRVLETYRYRPKNGYVFDQRTETLHFISPGRVLVRATARGSTIVRVLSDLDGWLSTTGPHLTLSDFAHRGRSDEIRFAVLRLDGSLVSRWSWRSPRGSNIDFGPVASSNGRAFAFRTVTRPRGDIVVYVLRPGDEQPVALVQHRGGQLGCGVGANFSWSGRFLLYSSTEGNAAVADVRRQQPILLTRLLRALPSRPEERPSVFWASELRPNAP